MFIHDDVRTLTARLIRDRLGYLPSVVVGSPPCQDASTANTKGRGVDGARTGLFFDAIRLVDEIRPAWACFENVPGIRARGADRIISALEALDYAVWPLVVGAWHAGAPHRRNRVWFVAAGADESRGARERVGRRQQQSESGAKEGLFADAGQGRRQPGGLEGLPERGPQSGADAQRRDAGVSADAMHIEQQQRGRRPAERRERGAKTVEGIAAAWPTWNGGAAAIGNLDDGLPAGLARKWVAAYGDAVCPQITEAIGRTMTALVPTDGAVLDLFAGAASGWSLGLSRAGYRTVAMCEIDEWRREVLRARHGE